MLAVEKPEDLIQVEKVNSIEEKQGPLKNTQTKNRWKDQRGKQLELDHRHI